MDPVCPKNQLLRLYRHSYLLVSPPLLETILSNAEMYLKIQMITYLRLNVAASKIDKELLHKIMEAIMNGSYDEDEALKLEIYNAINREL